MICFCITRLTDWEFMKYVMGLVLILYKKGYYLASDVL